MLNFKPSLEFFSVNDPLDLSLLRYNGENPVVAAKKYKKRVEKKIEKARAPGHIKFLSNELKRAIEQENTGIFTCRVEEELLGKMQSPVQLAANPIVKASSNLCTSDAMAVEEPSHQ